MFSTKDGPGGRGRLYFVVDQSSLFYQPDEGLGSTAELAFGAFELSVDRETRRVVAVSGYIGQPIQSTAAPDIRSATSSALFYDGPFEDAGVILRVSDGIPERAFADAELDLLWSGDLSGHVINFAPGCF